MLEKSADVNAADSGKRTPLHYASGLGRAKYAEELVKNDADIHAKDIRGLTPLHAAAKGPKGLGHDGSLKDLDKVVKILLKSGADMDTTESTGRSALNFALGFEAPARKELEKSGAQNLGPGQLIMF